MLARRAEAKSQQPVHEKESGELVACRTHLQWLLAKIGHKVGCQVWIATSDHNKTCNNERLGNLSLLSLPILVDSTFQKVISKIDVLWLRDQGVIAAYEIEQACTDVSISLLRLCILGDQQSALLSMHEVARRLGYPVRTIETHFPLLCRNISRRYAAYRKQQGQLRKACLRQRITEAARIVLMRGEKLTYHRVGAIIGEPGCFREYEARLVLRDIRCRLDAESSLD